MTLTIVDFYETTIVMNLPISEIEMCFDLIVTEEKSM
jgi:hypothetical protein